MPKTKIKKWGNSLALRIPKYLADELHLSKDDEVELFVEDNELRIRPQSLPKYSLDELVNEINEDNRHYEVDTGKPRGGEVW